MTKIAERFSNHVTRPSACVTCFARDGSTGQPLSFPPNTAPQACPSPGSRGSAGRFGRLRLPARATCARRRHALPAARKAARADSRGQRGRPKGALGTRAGSVATREQGPRAILREVLASGASEGSSERALTVDEKRSERSERASQLAGEVCGSRFVWVD